MVKNPINNDVHNPAIGNITFDEAVAFITAQATYDKKTEVKDVKETKEEKKIVNESTGSSWLDNLKKELK